MGYVRERAGQVAGISYPNLRRSNPSSGCDFPATTRASPWSVLSTTRKGAARSKPKFGSKCAGETMKRMLTLLFLLVSSAALAQKPTITPVYPDGFSFLAPTAQLCGFDTIDTPEPGPGAPLKEKYISFANGGVLVTGPLFVQLKNTNTGQIVDLSSVGPGTITVGSDGNTITIGGGLSIWNLPPPPLAVTQAAGLPPVPYTKGRVRVVFDAAGNITSMQLQGTAENVCSLFN